MIAWAAMGTSSAAKRPSPAITVSRLAYQWPMISFRPWADQERHVGRVGGRSRRV